MKNGRIQKSKVKENRINIRADKRLESVFLEFDSVYANRSRIINNSFFCKELLLEDFSYIEKMRLGYGCENRLLSISYNLQMEIITKPNEINSSRGDEEYVLTFSRGKKHLWECTKSIDSKIDQDIVKRNLAITLIEERIEKLDVCRMEIVHRRGEGFWRIALESLIGSSTWILVPPVMNTISIKEIECAQFAELGELIADAVINL